jgi:hypothetical protein
LSIWTHHLRGLEYREFFRLQGSDSKYANTLTIAAGQQMREIYAKAAQHGRIIVGGMDPNVGIGGYITGGGHAPISGHYGLAADQVLEITMVTPNGELVIANEAANVDLFWAMRGVSDHPSCHPFPNPVRLPCYQGGGATFGVLTSVTVKTFPMPSMGISFLQFNQSSGSRSEFWSAVALVHANLPVLASSGLMGYYFVTPYEHPVFEQPRLSFWWVAGILNSSKANVEATLTHLVSTLRDTGGLSVSLQTFDVPNFYDWWSANIRPGAAGTNVRLGSRLLDATSLSQNLSFIARRLEESFNGLALLGHLVGGPGVANVRPPGGFGAMTPAWRRTITHIGSHCATPYSNFAGEIMH